MLGANESLPLLNSRLTEDFLFQIQEGIDGVHDFENSPVSHCYCLQSEGFPSIIFGKVNKDGLTHPCQMVGVQEYHLNGVYCSSYQRMKVVFQLDHLHDDPLLSGAILFLHNLFKKSITKGTSFASVKITRIVSHMNTCLSPIS